MQLALRKSPPHGATIWQRIACWAIQARLVSAYSHGGIVIAGALYHATSARGLHCLPAYDWSPEHWDLIDVGGSDLEALALFDRYQGAAYDWLSLLAFVGIRGARDGAKMYCFEWCYLAMTGQLNTDRVTPETLLILQADRF